MAIPLPYSREAKMPGLGRTTIGVGMGACSPGEPEETEKNQDHEYGQDMGMTTGLDPASHPRVYKSYGKIPKLAFVELEFQKKRKIGHGKYLRVHAQEFLEGTRR